MDERSSGALRNADIGSGASLTSASVPSAAGGELFVINLCASMTPMTVEPKGLSGFEHQKLYQVSRIEDGRRRYRLRLGFFLTEAAAESALAVVRERYPTAFTACLSNEDMRFAPASSQAARPARSSVPVSTAPVGTGVPKPAATPTTPKAVAPASAAPQGSSSNRADGEIVEITIDVSTMAAAKPHPAQPSAAAAVTQHAATKPAVARAASVADSPVIELTLEPEPRTAPSPAATSNHDAPFHVAKGIEMPVIELELEPEALAAPAAAAQTPSTTPPAAVPQLTAQAATVSREKPVPPKGAQREIAAASTPAIAASAPVLPDLHDEMVPVLDTTQTLRTLTQAEIEDPSQPKWFAVQLAVSEQAVNLDTMPRLDIFAAYRLYSVATMGQGGIRHMLRLGFFREEVSAEAVSGYLKTFFPTPTIVRISTAEQSRFAEPPKPKAPPQSEAREQKVVQLSDKRVRDGKPPAVPTATAIAKPAPSQAGSSRVEQPKPAGKPVTTNAAGSRPAAAPRKQATTGKRPVAGGKSLSEQLKEEARQIELSESGIHRIPQRGSLLSRLVGRLRS